MKIQRRRESAKFRRRLTAVIAAVLMVAMLAPGGCGSSRPATLEEYAAEYPDQVKSIEDEITAMQTDAMIPSVEYEGNTVIMVPALTETFEGEDMIEALAEAFEEGMEEEKVGEIAFLEPGQSTDNPTFITDGGNDYDDFEVFVTARAGSCE